uniref:ARAD1C20504p n=1 Tax=Blastobotrys adeninivorans TaxID=409370 RepID=A0A060T1H2_BLAAD
MTSREVNGGETERIEGGVEPTAPDAPVEPADSVEVEEDEEPEVIIEHKGKLIHRYHEEKLAHGAGVNGAREMSAEEKKRFEELCEVCRSGDLDQVDKLVSYGVDVNAIDKFDCTPLILASLCGHEPVVKYLLEHGAVCDRDTFQGERCLYGALTDSIRRLLLRFDISKAVDEQQPFAAHISSLFSKPPVKVSDICFECDGEPFLLHRFVLAARSDYYARNLEERWPTSTRVKLTSAIDHQTFAYIVKYLYLYDQAIPTDRAALDKIVYAARKLQLVDLVAHLENSRAILSSDAATLSRARREQHQSEMWKARLQFEVFLEKHIFGRKVVLGPEDDDLSEQQLADLANKRTSADVILEVELGDGTMVYYPCHRSMLARSEYYQTMFSSPFSEGADGEEGWGNSRSLPIIQLPVDSVEVADIILRYFYTDKTDVPVSLAMEVLYAADLLLVERLKSFASISITNCGNDLPKGMDIFNILRAGWTLRLDRLEKYVAKYIADHFDYYINQQAFREIVVESAQRIKARQETDTIELIDDIRFYLAKKYGIIFEDDQDASSTAKIGRVYDDAFDISQYEREYNGTIDQIEDLLQDLQLDA